MEYRIHHPCPIIYESFLKYRDFSSFDGTILFVHHAHFYVQRCLLLLMLLSYGNGYVTLYNVLHYKVNTRKQNHLVFVVLACWSFIMCKSAGFRILYSASVCSFWMSWLSWIESYNLYNRNSLNLFSQCYWHNYNHRTGTKSSIL